MIKFCNKCGGVLPGQAMWFKGAYPCHCDRQAVNVNVGPSQIVVLDKERLRKMIQEELMKALEKIMR